MKLQEYEVVPALELIQTGFGSCNQRTSASRKWSFVLPRHNVVPLLEVITNYLKGWLYK